ncbi:MAG TPA: hypothetical protein VHX19_13295 [Stellaceae bacterium]|jgi:hypothetical protein|nr:hypothetical protein [Stellaceae bacterium]
MSNFRFFFFDALGTAKESATGEQASESDAIAEAERRLIERCELAAVEIWRGSNLVQALKRGGERWIAQPLGARLNLHPIFEAELA